MKENIIMIPDCTLTTACFLMTKYHNKCRNMDDALKNMTSLLETPCYLVIFTDDYMYEKIQGIRYNYNDMTKYIIMDVENLNTFKYLDMVKKNREIYHPTKDERTCSESHLVCSSKFELVLKTIELNPFNTTKFGWIDSNVGVNFSKICKNYQNNMLLNILDKCHPEKFNLQILNVTDKKFIQPENWYEYYKQYRWVVCGCLFITGKELGIKILTELNEVFIKHTLAGYGHGEEMYYLEILDKYYENIHRSYGDYNDILNNFLTATTGIEYIKKMIVEKYMHYGYHRECVDSCKYVLKEYENYSIPIDYEIYFNFMFLTFVSLFYINIEESRIVLKKILKLVDMNHKFRDVYLKEKKFYDQQFSFVM